MGKIQQTPLYTHLWDTDASHADRPGVKQSPYSKKASSRGRGPKSIYAQEQTKAAERMYDELRQRLERQRSWCFDPLY